jgi:cytochrome c553
MVDSFETRLQDTARSIGGPRRCIGAATLVLAQFRGGLMNRFGLTGVAMLLVFGGASGSDAANVAAGKQKSEACAACHGANGVGVADDIPNLAAQKTKYIVDQLKAFKAGTRKNPLMNAIAVQLDDGDIEDLAAFWNSLEGAAGDVASALLPSVTETRVAFPTDYKDTFTLYTTINFEDRKQVRKYFANTAALDAARDGAPLPDGSYLFVEVHAARLDGDGKPVTGPDGFYEADKLLFYTAMEMRDGWGASFPELLRNGDWNYAVFTDTGELRTNVNQAQCLACHKPLDSDSYVFSLKRLVEKAKQ